MGQCGAINIGAAGGGGNVLSRETPTPPRVQLNPAGVPAAQTSWRGFRGRGGASADGRGCNVAALLGYRANEIPSIALAPSAAQSHLRIRRLLPVTLSAHSTLSELLLVVGDACLSLSRPNTEAAGYSGSDSGWVQAMEQPWAVGSAEGTPARLPLVLTALWATAVGLELAYVLVLGPGPPPLGPLARALQLALAAFQLLNLLGNVGLFLRSDPSIRGVMLAGRGLGQGWA